MDGQILAGNISKSKNPAGFKIVGEPLSVEPIACMVRKGDKAFLDAVNKSIEAQIKDGSLAKLYDKWFMQPIPPTNTKVGLPLSDATKPRGPRPTASRWKSTSRSDAHGLIENARPLRRAFVFRFSFFFKQQRRGGPDGKLGLAGLPAGPGGQ